MAKPKGYDGKSYDRDSMCSGKVGHPLLRDALLAVEKHRGVRKKRKRLTIYRCRFCHNYHLGNDAGTIRPTAKKRRGDAHKIMD